MTELWRLSAAQLAAGFRGGAFTPVDALEACLGRIAQCRAALNHMVVVDEASARSAAEASRRRWAQGEPLSLLDGVPISLKDNLHAAGLPTTWGSRLLAGFVPSRDELPVARLRKAGALFLGKTNLPEFATQGYTSNLVSGTTRNPWDRALTPGGSSGGAVAAVASGCGPLAVATDGGGSTRRPASHCGLVGFKPSASLVPRSGGLPEIFLGYEVVGAIGRNLADVRTLMGVLAEADLAVSARPARILYVPRFADHPVDSGIAREVNEAARRFEQLGHSVEEAATFDLAEQVNALWPTLSAVGLAWMFGASDRWPEFASSSGQAPNISLCGDAAQASLSAGREVMGSTVFEILAAVQTLNRRLDALFAGHDFILTPATAALPWPAEQTHPSDIAGQAVGPRGHAVFTAFANAAGLPAIAMPCGFVRGLPTGFQLIGRAGADRPVLALAQQYEHAHPLMDRWPDL